jgi:hypothetical protein
MMAAAAVLSYMQRVKSDRMASLQRLVEMAIEILSAMDESNVARKCAEILKKHLEEIDEGRSATFPIPDAAPHPMSGNSLPVPQAEGYISGLSVSVYDCRALPRFLRL